MRKNWSAVGRQDRYRKRCEADGGECVDDDNPLPQMLDPITLEPVVAPAISPYGHVMGMATWKARGTPTRPRCALAQAHASLTAGAGGGGGGGGGATPAMGRWLAPPRCLVATGGTQPITAAPCLTARRGAPAGSVEMD